MTETANAARRHADEIGAAAESDDELIARYIVRNPHQLGPDRAKTVWGVSVWALVAYMRGEGNTIARTAEDYDLPEVAVRAALAYYRQNRALIDARLLINDAAFE